MQRSAEVVGALHRAGALLGAPSSARNLSTLVEKFTFGSPVDGPTSSLGSNIKISAKASAKGVDVSVSAGAGSAKASYASSDLRKVAAKPLVLQDVTRISTAHSSFMSYLLSLTHERYSVLASWPDFTKAYGKDYYYRAHPDDLRKFYSMVDEFHRMWDVVTEFGSLSGLAGQLVPGYRVRRHNTVHPALGPATADGAVVQFLLAHAEVRE
ncbi:mitochondrial F1F0 ATP synthase associated protein [Volvox carteri f. nagariensis]|uniref:Mitochondrial F1F0 ATP synthase associated protein n=1 Tax=Volvox carteri f. nagariensis TaxID=3068 RepID=D8UBV0_VOLCA|nr:mitochondrial F1F0 ATP synthase associated protein [Volvox carteri f. nagariensis]EFJ42832.1 mitochondrial F1F0 ATP synthase associated protein [Volvox carteri f. nagariensis]|eukprot:XP_002956092.1 mitochondrial F1F0 ATP synthase associated protein [Volvox carteri f. nagariensis]